MTSAQLALQLLRHGAYSVGTVISNRFGFPCAGTYSRGVCPVGILRRPARFIVFNLSVVLNHQCRIGKVDIRLVATSALLASSYHALPKVVRKSLRVHRHRNDEVFICRKPQKIMRSPPTTRGIFWPLNTSDRALSGLHCGNRMFYERICIDVERRKLYQLLYTISIASG